MAKPIVLVGRSCGIGDGSESDGSRMTVGELREAITIERELLERIYCILRLRSPNSTVSRDLTDKIHKIYPQFRWKATGRRRVP